MAAAAVHISALRKEYPGRGGHQRVVAVDGIDVEIAAGVWISAGLLAWLLSGMFALFGLAVAQTFRSESSVNIASAGLVLLAFLGNLFVPLSGAILDIARFTPMYGYSGLAHWPQLQGQIIGADDVTGRDPMWALILNVVVWSAISGLIAVWAVRRGRRRQ